MNLAHHPVAPGNVWSAWAFEPVTLLALLAATWFYARGIRRLRATRSRGSLRGRALAFYAGVGVVAAALLSPLHAVAEALLSAHMVQHLALMLLAAPLLVLGAPLLTTWLGMPPGARAVAGRLRRSLGPRARLLLTSPLLVIALHAAALWAWHLPEVYAAGLTEPALHALEHASFLSTAMLFWWVVLPGGSRKAPFRGLAVVFVTALQSAGLGALITFATRPLYSVHLTGSGVWGVSPLADQQLAGLLMWVPPGMLYLLTMAMLLLRWLRAMEHEPPRGTLAEAGDGR